MYFFSLIPDDHCGKSRVRSGLRPHTCPALFDVNLKDTSVSVDGLEILLTKCKTMRQLKAPANAWQALMSALAEGFVCADCVGVHEKMERVDLAVNKADTAEETARVFPMLVAIELQQPCRASDDQAWWREAQNPWPRLRELVLNGATLDDATERLLGPALLAQITSLQYIKGQTSLLLQALSDSAPFLERLHVEKSSIAGVARFGMFPNLRNLSLVNIAAGPPIWASLARSAVTTLETLRLWGVAASDADVSLVLADGPYPKLCDFRVGSDDIGLVRLSESSMSALLSACPSLVAVGGVCDWAGVRDLYSMMKTMLAPKRGWKVIVKF